MQKMKLQLKAAVSVDISTLDIKDSAHPNKMPFEGTLLFLDQPSDQPPHGSEGHPILVTKAAAQRRLDSLVGMPLNYRGDLQGHNSEEPVGVISRSWIDGNAVKVQGLIWKKSVPSAERDLKGRKLGMSMELADVEIADKQADVWTLNDFYFVGATALWPDAAAYQSTSMAASRDKNSQVLDLAAAAFLGLGRKQMATKTRKVATGKSQGQLLIEAITAGVAKAIAPVAEGLQALRTEFKEMKASGGRTEEEEAQDALETELNEQLLAAGKKKEDEDEDEDEDEELDAGRKVKSKGKKDEDEDEDEDEELDAGRKMKSKKSKSDDSDDDQDDDGNEDDDSGDDEEAMKGKKVKAKKKMDAATERPTIKASTAIQAAALIRDLRAESAQLRRDLKAEKKDHGATKNRIEAIEAQLEVYASRVERRTLTPELGAIMEKAGVNVGGIQASQLRKLSIGKVDQILANCGVVLDPQTRMYFKNQLAQAGVMDEGFVTPQSAN